MNQQLDRQIYDLARGSHACLIYEDEKARIEAVLPFIRSGLDRNEACFYLANERTESEIKNFLSAAGINMRRELDRGAITLSQNHLPSGNFETEALVDSLINRVEECQKRGFSGLRATGEMTWVLEAGCNCEHLTRYEATLNERFPIRLTGLCQYNRTRFSPEILQNIIRTHPVVITGARVCRNLYCESGKILSDTPNDMGVNWMINNLIRFQTTEDDLRSKIHVRDNFFSAASHELKNTITAMKLHIEMHAGKKKVTADEWQHFRKLHDRNVKQIAGIVGDMMDTTKISRGLLHLDLRDNVDLVDVVRLSVANLPDTASIRIKAPKAINGSWDAVRLGQVVDNLLSNAVKYGNGRPIEISISGDGNRARFAIKDHGIGIDPFHHQKIFSLYERVIQSNNVRGLGIGLYICNQIILAHKGTLRVESELGKGSTFHVDLPRSLARRITKP